MTAQEGHLVVGVFITCVGVFAATARVWWGVVACLFLMLLWLS